MTAPRKRQTIPWPLLILIPACLAFAGVMLVAALWAGDVVAVTGL